MAKIEARIIGCDSLFTVDTETYRSSTIVHTPTTLPPEDQRSYSQQNQAAQPAVERMICPVAKATGGFEPFIKATSGNLTVGDLSLLTMKYSQFRDKQAAIYQTFFSQALSCDCWQTGACPLFNK